MYILGVGLTWSNLNPSLNDDTFSMADVFVMLAVDFFLYALIAWYVDAVMPGDYGIPQPLYFPFTVSQNMP